MRLLIAMLLVACGGRHEAARPVSAPPAPPIVTPDAAPPPPAPEIIGVALTVSPSAAHVAIDGTDHGEASGLAPVVPLEPGLHNIVITHDGYKPFRVEFAVSNKTERLTVRLERAR